jgi:hypothetical protein
MEAVSVASGKYYGSKFKFTFNSVPLYNLSSREKFLKFLCCFLKKIKQIFYRKTKVTEEKENTKKREKYFMKNISSRIEY